MAKTKMAGPGSADAGKLVLRATLALLILLHGIAKLRGGIGPIEGMLAQHGLPAALGYGVYVGEVLAPLLMLAGVWTRLAALVVAVNMVLAIVLAHGGQLFDLNRTGGWAIELQAMFLASAVAVALLGAGRYSMAGSGGRYN